MDSGNSSSMQSSSCGGGCEEECDSSCADHSISALLNHDTAAALNTTTLPLHHHHNRPINVGGGGPIPDPPPPSPPLHHQTHIDPLMPNYFMTTNMLWSSSRPPGGHPDLAGLHLTPLASHPAPPQPHQHFFTNPHNQQSLIRPPNTTDSAPISADLIKNNINNINHVARNPKKRSRASRRAPTTVLTTDTTNFRAMVQEFTGIPAPPFAGSLPFPRNNRFDLFGSPSSPFPLKPFAQKLPAPSFLFSSNSSIGIASSSSSSLGYCIPSGENQNLLTTNTQSITNPILNFQAPKNPLADLSILTSKSKALFDPSHQNVRTSNGLVEEYFGYGGTSFGGFQNIMYSSSTSTLAHCRNETSDIENGGVDLLRTIGGNFDESQHRDSSYRASVMVAAAGTDVSSSTPENNLAAARNEGMVESSSWVCSSD